MRLAFRPATKSTSTTSQPTGATSKRDDHSKIGDIEGESTDRGPDRFEKVRPENALRSLLVGSQPLASPGAAALESVVPGTEPAPTSLDGDRSVLAGLVEPVITR